jgi:hypothetical protein
MAQRERVERLLRTAAGLALVAALGIVFWEASLGESAVERTTWRIAESPSPAVRDSLAALQRAGRAVTWSGDVAPLMAMAEPVREPGDRWRIAALNDTPLLVRDSLGPLDSLDAVGALTTDAVRGAVRVVAGGTEARVAPADSVSLGRVAVYGRAGWEPRFVIAALEEAGWKVDARLTLGRDRDVLQGEIIPRRARHAAVVVFDTASLVREGALFARFVREGGGLVLAGDAAAADVPALRALVGAQVTKLEPPETRSFEGHEPTHALPLHVLGTRRADAVLVESREGLPAIVARRVGAGRIVQMGYADTWRWRMEGEGRAVEEHRTFWSRTVGLAAAATAVPRLLLMDGVAMPRDIARDDPAPRAALIHALGPAATEAQVESRGPMELPRWLGLVILSLLLAEWASRRGRGAA